MRQMAGRQNLNVRQLIGRVRHRQVTVHVPETSECPTFGCGYDSDLGGSKDPACDACNGTGLVVTHHVSWLPARIMWVDPAHMRFVRDGSVMTGEVGDCALQIDIAHLPLVEACANNQDAYITVDNKRVRPDSETINRVAATSSYDVRCHLVKTRI